MSRWAPDARARLELAALELFEERGYRDVTVAQIVARAGLTVRTFYRYFPDKREALFWGQDELVEHVAGAVEGAPQGAPPFSLVGRALESVCPYIPDRPDFSSRRRAVIDSTPELKQRELAKLGTLATAIAAALQRRGAEETVARLAAGAGVSAFGLAVELWGRGSDERPLATVLQDVLEQLSDLTATDRPTADRASGRP